MPLQVAVLMVVILVLLMKEVKNTKIEWLPVSYCLYTFLWMSALIGSDVTENENMHSLDATILRKLYKKKMTNRSGQWNEDEK
jgi:hypothetical protein